ncbi:diguanylate cyclase [Salinisphaera sp. C84B14]|uniref:GGDEF domain-containing protein n=1 Tax=Salinisphaera sp. C84B14 TaxID=1304155 RepID=UPI0032B18E96|tara:strand:- start:346 stop:1377 length:1032 start_codon:yes stop_codon:yes gene_type:complete
MKNLFLKRDRPAEVRPYQRTVFTALLWFTCSAVLGYAGLHFYLGYRWLAVAELCLVAYAALLLYVVHETERAPVTNVLFVVPFFIVMMLSLWTGATGVTVFIWVFLVPLLSHLLLGRWQGLWVALLFIGCAGAIFVYKHGIWGGWIGYLSVVNVVLCTGSILGFSYIYEASREKTEHELRALALADPLTGLANRSRFREVFARERQRYLRQKIPLAMLVVDLDHFKRVNDDYGHDAGDMALCFVAELLASRIRQTDVAGRLGGEEFGILLSDVDLEHARRIAVDLRDLVRDRPFRYRGKDIPMSVSIGIAELGRDGMDFRTLFSKADRRLYQAKAEGRNRVVG